MSYRIYEGIKAYVGQDGGAVLAGLYHNNNGGIFIEQDGTRPGPSELDVYVAESIDALKVHLMEKQFEEEILPAEIIDAKTVGAFDCIVKGIPCEWEGLLRAQMDALSDPLILGREDDLDGALYGMAGFDHNELCAVQLEKILGMVADGNREFFGRIRRSNAEVHPSRMRYDTASPVRTLEEAKMFDDLFGYGAAIPYLTEEIRNDLDKLADYLDVRDGMKDVLFESEKFYLAAGRRLLHENLEQILQAGGKHHTYPFIPEEIKARFSAEYTARLIKEGTIRYADIPEELREDPEIESIYVNTQSEKDMFTDRPDGVEEPESETLEDPMWGPIEKNLVILKMLSDICAERVGLRFSFSPLMNDDIGEHGEYEVSLSGAGRVFYFTADSCDPQMGEKLSDEIKAAAEKQEMPELKAMLLQAAGDVRRNKPELMENEKGKAVKEGEAEQKEILSGTFEDYYGYGLGL